MSHAVKNYNKADILEFIDGLTESQLLQNSALIYATESTKSNDLVNYIRFSNITLEQLNVEKEKISKLMESAGVTESTVPDNINMFNTVIESAIRRKTNMKCIVNEHMMHFLEGQMFDSIKDTPYKNGTVLEGVCLDDIANILEYENSCDKITPKGIATLVQLICSPDSPFYDTDEVNKIKQCLINKLRCTLKYQMTHDEFKDIPVMPAVKYTRDYMKDVYHGFEEIEDKIDDVFDELDENLDCYLKEEAIDAPFNPNPFNVYNLCPFPVGTRDLHRSFMDIACAETDEELDEAMMDYARLESMYIYSVSEASSDEPKAKIARGMARASNKATNAVRGAVAKKNEFKRDVSKISEPMIKFAEETINKMKDADEEERRNLIIKGGIMPKAIRWLKRGIGLVIVGSLGSTGTIIAIISLLTMIATDKTLDARERAKVLRELEDELNVVEEKIDDSRGDENKQKKYELIRIRNKLKSDITRVKLRLRN